MDTPPSPTVVQSEKPASNTSPSKPSAKPSEKDSTKVASLFVSIAALIVSGSSFYQAYLNRMYAEDINQPVLTTAMASEGLFFPVPIRLRQTPATYRLTGAQRRRGLIGHS
jgi:hypothetical protein